MGKLQPLKGLLHLGDLWDPPQPLLSPGCLQPMPGWQSRPTLPSAGSPSGSFCSGPHHWSGHDFFRAALKCKTPLPQSSLLLSFLMCQTCITVRVLAPPTLTPLLLYPLQAFSWQIAWMSDSILVSASQITQSDPLRKTGKVSLGLLLLLISQHKWLSMGNLPWSFVWSSPFHLFLHGLFIFHGNCKPPVQTSSISSLRTSGIKNVQFEWARHPWYINIALK